MIWLYASSLTLLFPPTSSPSPSIKVHLCCPNNLECVVFPRSISWPPRGYIFKVNWPFLSQQLTVDDSSSARGGILSALGLHRPYAFSDNHRAFVCTVLFKRPHSLVVIHPIWLLHSDSSSTGITEPLEVGCPMYVSLSTEHSAVSHFLNLVSVELCIEHHLLWTTRFW